LNLLAKNYVDVVVFDAIISVQGFLSIIVGRIFLMERYDPKTYFKLMVVVVLLVGIVVI